MRPGYGDLRDPGCPMGYLSVSSLDALAQSSLWSVFDARLRPGVGFTAVFIRSESCIDDRFGS
jgi:hypothetical protein